MTKPERSSRLNIAVKKVIRVRKEDSAFVYFMLESYEGITSYSTLPFRESDPHRDLELQIPVLFLEETEELLRRLGDMVYEIRSDSEG